MGSESSACSIQQHWVKTLDGLYTWNICMDKGAVTKSVKQGQVVTYPMRAIVNNEQVVLCTKHFGVLVYSGTVICTKFNSDQLVYQALDEKDIAKLELTPNFGLHIFENARNYLEEQKLFEHAKRYKPTQFTDCQCRMFVDKCIANKELWHK